MIISLKRFKTSRSQNKYGFGGSGQKIDTLVEFPLTGLDMPPFVIMPEQKNSANLIYDCFGISNHFGSAGFGHYTAYAKNPIDHLWYNFDDSSVSPTQGSRYHNLVSNAAYNLFYRLRGREGETMETLDLDADVM